VVIAVLDTGIDKEQVDLVGKVIAEVNFTDSPTTDDIYGHGTHIAGIIAAWAESGTGVAGLAHDCRLMNVKVADDQGRFDSSVAAKGVNWAVEHGANVINMSLVSTEPSPILEEAINYAWNQGVVVVAAAGNLVGTKVVYPAYYSNCIAVAATDSDDHVASWSSQGDWVDLAAPGVDIYSTLPGNKYGYKSGTSMAAAHVSGLAGLLFTLENDRNGNGFVNDEVRAAIENGCDGLNIGTVKGRINAFQAVNRALTSR
jgi:thermitase